MAREFFKDLPNTTTPLTASRLNGLLNGDEALGSIVVDDVNGKNIYDGNFEIGGYSQTTGEKTTSSTQYRNANPIPCKPNTTYTFSINGTKYTSNIRYFFYGANLNYLSSEASGTGNITTPSNCYYVSYHSTGLKTDYPNGLSKAQIEKGSTATEYTEYKQPVKKTSIGVKESCTFYANDFKCKNLFSGIMYNGIINQSGAYVTNNARITNTTANGFFLPQGTYTLSIADLDACTIVIKNASGTVIQDLADSWKTLPFTFTTTQDGYICFSAKKNNDATLNPNDYAPQLEIGSEATSYTPYKNFDGEIYSTGETKIGTWIDGKPLYRKTFNSTLTGTTGSKEFDLSGMSIDTVTHIYGTTYSYVNNRVIYRNIAGTYAYNGSVTEWSGAYTSGTSLIFRWYNLQITNVWVTIEYTKTTSGTRMLNVVNEGDGENR